MDCIPGKRIRFSSKSNQLCNWWDSPIASNYLFCGQLIIIAKCKCVAFYMLNPKIIFLGKTSNTNEVDYHLRIDSQSLFRVRLIPTYRGGSHRPKPFLCFCHKKGPEEADASKGEFMGLVRGSYPQEKGVTHRQISFTVYSVEWLPDGYRRATVMGRTQRPGGGPI